MRYQSTHHPQHTFENQLKPISLRSIAVAQRDQGGGKIKTKSPKTIGLKNDSTNKRALQVVVRQSAKKVKKITYLA